MTRDLARRIGFEPPFLFVDNLLGIVTSGSTFRRAIASGRAWLPVQPRSDQGCRAFAANSVEFGPILGVMLTPRQENPARREQQKFKTDLDKRGFRPGLPDFCPRSDGQHL